MNIQTVWKYRMEFNEEQQVFHLDHGRMPANTFGWFTIADNITDDDFMIFEAYVNRIKKEKLTKDYILKCYTELQGFISNLGEYKMSIVRDNQDD